MAIPLLIAFHFVDFSTGSAVAAKFLDLCKLLTPSAGEEDTVKVEERYCGRKVKRYAGVGN